MKTAGSNRLVYGLVLAFAVLAGCNGNSNDSADATSASVPGQASSLAQTASAADASASSASSSSSTASASAATDSAPSVPTAAGSTATLSWLPPTTNTDGTVITDLAGYRIYYGTDQNALNQVIDISNVGVTTYVMQDLAAGTWYFAVKAYTTTGAESSLSNVASKTIA